MLAVAKTSAALAALLAVLPAARGHMSIWDPSMYGFNSGYEVVNPLSGLSFNNWVSRVTLTPHRPPQNPL
jgi:hypothetical protein